MRTIGFALCGSDAGYQPAPKARRGSCRSNNVDLVREPSYFPIRLFGKWGGVRSRASFFLHFIQQTFLVECVIKALNYNVMYYVRVFS